MRHKKCAINPFDSKSIDEAIATLEAEKQLFISNCNLFINRLAELARNTIQSAYGSSVTVSIQQIDGGCKIVASGKDIMFIEFGSGDMTNSANRFASQVPFDVSPGSWSRSANSKSHMYARFGWWVFGGQIYRYTVPTNAMEKGYETVITEFVNVANEVFK